MPKQNCHRELSRYIRTCIPYSCKLNEKTEDYAHILGVKDGQCAYRLDAKPTRINCAFPKEMLEPLSDEFKQQAWIEELGPVKKSRVVYKIDHKKGTREKIGQIYIGGLWLEPSHVLHDAKVAGMCQPF